MAPKLSVVIPIHASMKNGDYFLWRSIQALMRQSFKDFEIVIVQEGSMPVNTNAGIQKARGELIKILYLDDYLAHDHSLEEIVKNFSPEDQWLATGCLHQRTGGKDFWEDPHSPHLPKYSPDIYTGNNLIGGPSVITIRNKGHLTFDENLSWLLDCDLYYRYFQKYGAPKLLNDLNVVMGIHEDQTSVTMPSLEKTKEYEYVMAKYNED